MVCQSNISTVPDPIYSYEFGISDILMIDVVKDHHLRWGVKYQLWLL